VRILHLVDRLTDRGGAYRHLLGVLDALAPGHESVLAVGVDEGSATPRARLRVVPGLEARTALPVDLDSLRDAVRPDVVHAHNLMNPAALAWAAAQERAVLTVQDHRFFCPTRGKWTTDGRVCREAMSQDVCAGCFDDDAYFADVFALTRARLAEARRLSVVVLSRYMRGELLAAGLSPERVQVVPPFVHDLEPRARPDGPPCVLFVGRLVEAKGVADAVLAWRRSGVDLPLLCAGTGPLRESAARSGAQVLGWVSRERLGALYARARAVLVPSRWQEPFGIVGLEALHCGAPVVAYEGGGIAEWHPGGDLLVPWGDVDALAAALGRAVALPAADRPAPPPGFARAALMEELIAVYAGAAAK
jgi:glycosyltransferase involved in cell wall biosynthesis